MQQYSFVWQEKMTNFDIKREAPTGAEIGVRPVSIDGTAGEWVSFDEETFFAIETLLNRLMGSGGLIDHYGDNLIAGAVWQNAMVEIQRDYERIWSTSQDATNITWGVPEWLLQIPGLRHQIAESGTAELASVAQFLKEILEISFAWSNQFDLVEIAGV